MVSGMFYRLEANGVVVAKSLTHLPFQVQTIPGSITKCVVPNQMDVDLRLFIVSLICFLGSNDVCFGCLHTKNQISRSSLSGQNKLIPGGGV